MDGMDEMDEVDGIVDVVKLKSANSHNAKSLGMMKTMMGKLQNNTTTSRLEYVKTGVVLHLGKLVTSR